MSRLAPFHDFIAHESQVNCATFSPTSQTLLGTGGEDQIVNVWKISNATNLLSLSDNKVY